MIRRLLMGNLSWKALLFRIGFTGFIGLVAYLIYLDSKMQSVFAHMTQVQAVEVLARPLQIRSGDVLLKSDLVAELKALNYQKVAAPARAGQFAESSTKLEILLKPDATTTPSKTGRVMLYFEGERVATIRSQPHQSIEAIQLPAQVVAKLWPGKREDRIPVALNEVPQRLIELLLWVEDRDFYEHWGVNPMAIARALVVNISAGRTVQGGSTLTQQLAKNLLLTRQRSLVRKLNEALLALLMEWHFSKEQILQAYINEVYLGQSGATAIHGFASASQFYFAKPLAQLTLEQQVMLVAMVKGPSLYHPWRHPDKLKARRDLLLRSLMEQQRIRSETYIAATDAPLGVLSKGHITRRQRPALASAVKKELEQRAGWQLNDGLNAIQTTVDPLSQHAMEQAVQTAIPVLEKRHQIDQLQVAMLAVDRSSGAVRALVSDRNPSFPGYNRVLNANRPIGSLLKPFILMSGLKHNNQMSLATSLNDRPVSMRTRKGQRWQPQNFDHQYRGSVPAITALAKSLNVPFVNLGMSVGLETVHADLQQLIPQPLETLYPSDLLGSLSFTPWQVAQLYSTIAANGLYQPLHLLNAVHLPSAWYELSPPYQERRLSSAISYQLLYAMQTVTQNGTAKALKQLLPGAALAGKTGTTNEYRDTWFVGIDERELIVVWVGRDDNQPIRLTGSKAAMRVYAAYQARRTPIPLQLKATEEIAMSGFNDEGEAVAQGCDYQYWLPIARERLTTQLGCEAISVQQNKTKPWWKKMLKL